MEIIIMLLLLILVFFAFLEAKDLINGCEIDSKFYVIFTLILSCIIFVMYLINFNKPRAIDVYKGKTTLEITYKDKVPIDSIVVWKDK